jgi:predicted enzyme related to lactoylglutathione lyase
MTKLNHIAIPVSDWRASSDWYTNILGLSLEFEIPERLVAAVKDEGDFAIFLHQAPVPSAPIAFAFTFQVADVHKSFQQITQKGITFSYAPQRLAWGYGAELIDPNGYRVCIWDEKSMRENT